MSQPNPDDLIDGFNGELEATSSRRSIVKRLAALGLVAAGGLALAPRAEAKPKRGGENGGDGEKGQGGKGKEQGVQANGSSGLPYPQISPFGGESKIFQIGRRQPGYNYPMIVNGTIAFDPRLVALMRQGRWIKLSCQVWSWTRLESGSFAYRWVADVPPGDRTIPVAWGGSSAGLSKRFYFYGWVPGDKLNTNDAPTLDSIHARVYVQTRQRAGAPWQYMKRADGREYFKLDAIQGNF